MIEPTSNPLAHWVRDCFDSNPLFLEPTSVRTHFSRTHLQVGSHGKHHSVSHWVRVGSRGGFAKQVGSQWVRVGSRKVGSRKVGSRSGFAVSGRVGSRWVRAPWPSGNSLVRPQPGAEVKKAGRRGRRGCARHPDRWHGEQVQRPHRPHCCRWDPTLASRGHTLTGGHTLGWGGILRRHPHGGATLCGS